MACDNSSDVTISTNYFKKFFFFTGDQPLPHVRDEDAEEFKLMQSQPSHNIDGLAIKSGSDSIKEGNRKSVTFTDGNQQTGAQYSNPSLPYDVV